MLISALIVDSHVILVLVGVAVLVLNVDLVGDSALLVHFVAVAVLIFLNNNTRLEGYY
jgi:hypothetical protein